MSKAKGARCCIVGSITGNTNTVGGGLVYPQADLGKLQGFEKGGVNPVAMVDGKPFFGAKAYKDSKVKKYICLFKEYISFTEKKEENDLIYIIFITLYFERFVI